MASQRKGTRCLQLSRRLALPLAALLLAGCTAQNAYREGRELVEQDLYSFGQIAKLMGLGRNQVTARWRRIVTRMGAQAV